jgi:type IV pilus assembly protein PilB
MDPKALSDFILEYGFVSKRDLDAAVEEARNNPNKNIGQILVSAGKITEEDLNFIKGHALGIPVVDLKGEKIDLSILSKIPEPIARKHNVIAYKQSDRGLEVAMLDTEDLVAVDFIKKKLDIKILPRLTDKDSIKYALLQYQKSLKAEFGEIISKEAMELKVSPDVSTDVEGDLKKMAQELPVVRMVDTLLNHAIIQKASDIHIEPY